jgi:molybdopterin-guanine dinucleotide biosynthesis protein A
MMDCIITAGGNPEPGDPLYPYTQGNSKALLDMNGRTMLERVVDALQESQYVEEIVIIGLGSDLGMQFRRPVHHLPDQGGLVSNAIAGIDWLIENRPEATEFLGCSADIPLISGNMVDAYIDSCRPFDQAFYYILVTKETMESRFPGSNRTFVKLRDADVAGGDVVIMRFDIALANRKLWEQMANARKHAWQIARAVGLRVLLKLLIRRLSVADIEATSARLIGSPVKVVFEQHAEMAMDADKPHQVELLRSELERLAN